MYARSLVAPPMYPWLVYTNEYEASPLIVPPSETGRYSLSKVTVAPWLPDSGLRKVRVVS